MKQSQNQLERSERQEVLSIDLLAVFGACLQRWWQILVIAILGGVLALGYTTFCVKPTYQSTTKIYVNNADSSVGNIGITAADLNASNSLVKVYSEILNTKKTLDIVNEKAGLDYDHRKMMEMISTQEANGTPVLTITVTNTSPDEAHLIAATIADVLPGIITDTIKSSEAVVIDGAIYPMEQSSPDPVKNTVIGVLIGAVFVIGWIVFNEVFSEQIKSERDIRAVTDIPILGCITAFDGKEAKGNRDVRQCGRSFGGKDK